MRELSKALRIAIVFIIILGLIYPLTMTGISSLIFPKASAGSLMSNDGIVVGSELIGQNFTQDKWFHGRPSAVDNNGIKSGGTNASITSKAYKDTLNKNIEEILKENPSLKREDIPSDMVTASSSGLDPDISVENALLQVNRVAKANEISADEVKGIINSNSEGKFLNIFGEKTVNVLKLNLKLLKKTKR